MTDVLGRSPRRPSAGGGRRARDRHHGARSAASGRGQDRRRRDGDILLVSLLLPLTTFGILCYEIVLTRVFAYVFAYDLTAMAVSSAMFGLGAGAYVRVRWLSGLPQRVLAVGAHLASAVALVALYVVLMLTHDTAAVIVVSAMPFAVAGVAVSHYYEERRSARAAATYALDLSGAAAACVASVVLLESVGADAALLCLAGLGAGAAMLALMRTPSPSRAAWLLVGALAGVLPGAIYVARSQLPDPLLNRHSSVHKQLPNLLREQGKVVDTAWSAVGRADLYETPTEPDIKVILTDATNSTAFVSRELGEFQRLFASVPYAVAPVRKALILGSGAGLEVHIARAAGVPDVEAVELNPAIVRLVRRWQRFGGPIYDQPGVTLFVDEARKFLLTTQRRYDLIQLSLVLTATAQSGTYALAEGYLYTEEAFRSYLEHLEPTGALAMIDDSLERTLKNTVTAVTVFERAFGLRSDQAMQHIAVIANPREWEPGYKYLLLVSPTPLSDERIRRLGEEIARRPLDALWLPGGPATSQFQGLATGGARAFVRGADINLAPPTDDRPYLNNFAKAPADVVRLLGPYLLSSLLTLAALGVVFVTDGMSRGSAGRRSTALAAIYGVGFMLIEMGLLHKLTLAVGGPTYVLSVLLFALLLYCGLGSLLSGRLAATVRPRLGSFALVVALVGVVTAEVIERCYLLDGVSSSVVRVACVLAIVAPLGLSLGAPFPDLLRRYGQSDDRHVAYLWAVNGLASVLGGGLTLIAALMLGHHVVLLAGSALYLLAWTIDRRETDSPA